MRVIIFFVLFAMYSPVCDGQSNIQRSNGWSANWISTMESQSETNTWLAFRRTISVSNIPVQAIAKIAVDSKYWLWINGKLVVFEGGLKRGPSPYDSYYDEVDIAPFLKKGRNIVAIQVWYFGKDGFSHKSSGRAGLLFDCKADGFELYSDASWQCAVLGAYQSCSEPKPNFRLPESSILFDARKSIGNWQGDTSISLSDVTGSANATVLGHAGDHPWNKLNRRPIPLWKDYGYRKFKTASTSNTVSVDTLMYDLEYNTQFTPYIIIDSDRDGDTVKLFTDNYLLYFAGASGLRSEYITKKGRQEYESLGWMNGHRMYVVVPKHVKVIEAGYRETGYATAFTGSFQSSDAFMNTIWQKSLRTLYVTMRDSYMDCPDRERAQWTGDAVHESGEAFYALDTASHLLTRKWLREFADWQRTDSSLYGPVPSGNWSLELPDQSLATIGYYGLWNYFINTGDTVTLAHVYPAAKKYLALWKIDNDGIVAFRKGGWPWGDWGDNKDMELIFNLLYAIAVKGMALSAEVLNKKEDAASYKVFLEKFKQSFNTQFWNGKVYRHPKYTLLDDDRVQALAVVAGVADKDKYQAIVKMLQASEHASPYMEKYVMEAFFLMGYEKQGLQRCRKRFANMVNDRQFTTLWEGWEYNNPAFGGGTVNHAWSGGALTILSQYLCGIAPVLPGYNTFQVLPQPGDIKAASAVVDSKIGLIKTWFSVSAKKFEMVVTVPVGADAIIGVPAENVVAITLNGRLVWKKGKSFDESLVSTGSEHRHIKFKKPSGVWNMVATYK